LHSGKYAENVKIAFDRIGTSPKTFSVQYDQATFEGEMLRKGSHYIDFHGVISGEIDLNCDRCGKAYTHVLNESVALKISDAIVQDKEDLDIIEFLDGVIDVTYIAESEIHALTGDYHFCPKCMQSDTPLEIEI